MAVQGHLEKYLNLIWKVKELPKLYIAPEVFV